MAADDGEFAANTRTLHGAMKGKNKTLKVVAGFEHGTALIVEPQTAAQVTAFLDALGG